MADNPIMEPGELFYGKAESTEELKESTEIETVTEEDTQTLETEDKVAESTDEESDELEAEDESSETEGDEEELVYLDLDGKEVDLDEIRKWRDGHLMQADYTRKTQELANERKEVKAEREQVEALKSQLTEQYAELQALIAEDESADLTELKQYDPEKYIEVKERLDKRKAAAEKVKAELGQKSISQDVIAAEQKALFEANPSWIDDKGKPTKQFEEDSNMVAEYWKREGFTQDEIASMHTARQIQAFLKAAKFDALQNKSQQIKSKTKKATLVTKPKTQQPKPKKPKDIADVFYGS